MRPKLDKQSFEKFTNVIPRAAKAIESDLFQRYHVAADFKGSDLIAETLTRQILKYPETILPQNLEFFEHKLCISKTNTH